MQFMQTPAFADKVRLEDRIVKSGNPSSRCPSRPLILEQNNYVLTLPNSEEQMFVKLMMDGIIVYEKFIGFSKETIEFPNYLQGEYQISLVMGDKEYIGTINL